MIPSVYALIVLTIGLILIHFGVANLEKQLAAITVVPVMPPAGAATR